MNEINFISVNQEQTYISIGTNIGFRVFKTYPFICVKDEGKLLIINITKQLDLYQ